MRYLLFITTLFLLTPAQAQVSFGLLAGYNRSQEKYDVEVPEDAQLHIASYHISGLLTVPVSKRFSVMTEAGFIQRGAACEPGFVGFAQDSELRLHYGNLTVNTSYDVLKWGRLKVSAYAGFSGSYLLSGNTTITFEDFQGPGRVRRDLELENNDRWNRLDTGLSYGSMIKFQFGCGDIITRVGGYRGFIDVDSNNGSLSRDLLLSIGYSQGL